VLLLLLLLLLLLRLLLRLLRLPRWRRILRLLVAIVTPVHPTPVSVSGELRRENEWVSLRLRRPGQNYRLHLYTEL
jgi:hypothetical protein